MFLFFFLVFWPRGIWDLSSLTRDRTHAPCIGRQRLNHWTTREVPSRVDYKRAQGNFAVQWICSLSGLWWWFHGHVHMSKLIKLYTLSMCRLLYVSYTSKKLKEKQKTTSKEWDWKYYSWAIGRTLDYNNSSSATPHQAHVKPSQALSHLILIKDLGGKGGVGTMSSLLKFPQWVSDKPGIGPTSKQSHRPSSKVQRSIYSWLCHWTAMELSWEGPQQISFWGLEHPPSNISL